MMKKGEKMASIYSVSQVNSYIKNMFIQDFMLAHIFVKGEVSNCKYHTSGHIYFTIKDETSVIVCVMFAGNRKGLGFSLQEGQTVIVEGSISVYERDGKYELYAKKITLDGTGILYQRFEERKHRLEEMGMFAEEYKKPIPRFARTVGIVTASTGAAIRDIMNIAVRRNPYVQLILYPALVQGEGAKETIAEGIECLDRLGVDVIIVGRGGGSIEDLWAFNEECVAWAIFECQTPIISAVGHEVDVTIADYVADLRAPTPSAAAELAIYDYQLFFHTLSEKKKLLTQKMNGQLKRTHSELEQAALKLNYRSPQNEILKKRQHLLAMEERIQERMEQKIGKAKHQIALVSQRLEGNSPFKRLQKGYAYVCDEKEKALKSVRQIKPGEKISIRMIDGTILANVQEIQTIKG